MIDGSGRSAREEAEYQKIIWPGTGTYRNKLGIRDPVELEMAERMIVSRRVEQGFPAQCTPYTYEGFRALHHHMFQDLYDWAGKERRYTSGRGPVPFAAPEHIGTWVEKQFATLDARQKFHMRRDRTAFVTQAATLVNEINAAHPFIDGNGRTQRQWLRLLAADMGYELRIRSVDKDRWNTASRVGFEKSDHAPMSAFLEHRLRPSTRKQARDRSQ